MAEVSTKKRKQAQEEPTETVFQTLGIKDPSGEDTLGAKRAEDPRVTALETRLAAMDEQLRKSQEANFALMAQPIRVEPAAKAPEPVKVSFDGLPDPYSEPEAYGKALNDRIQKAVEAGIAQTQQQMSRVSEIDGRGDQLWENFAEKYEDLAENPDRVEFATTKVVQRAQQRGLNLERYMFGAQDRFFEDVAAEMKKLWPTPKDEDEGEPEGKKGEEEPSGRTEGIFGGLEGVTNPMKREEPQSTMVKDIQDLQRASGLF